MSAENVHALPPKATYAKVQLGMSAAAYQADIRAQWLATDWSPSEAALLSGSATFLIDNFLRELNHKLSELDVLFNQRAYIRAPIAIPAWRWGSIIFHADVSADVRFPCASPPSSVAGSSPPLPDNDHFRNT